VIAAAVIAASMRDFSLRAETTEDTEDTEVSQATAAIHPPAATPMEWASQQVEELVAIYKTYHQSPELSFQEVETAERLAGELRRIGCEVTTGVGKHGVVGLLKNGDGPVVLVRADLDGLPVTEATGLEYASRARGRDNSGNDVGVMHACGHDVHITCLIGTARYLAAHRDRWQGTVMFIGQPAEEIGSGAIAMLKDGLFTRFPRPSYGLALHCDASMPTGKVGYRSGYILANTDSVTITVHGKGGHGAYPHTTIDPVVQAAHLVIDLQTLVSRENSPLEPAVITVGSIHGGSKHNIIGDRCVLQLTVRSYSDKVRKRLLDGIQRKAKAVAESAAAPAPTIVIENGTPALKNDADLVERLLPVFAATVGAENVVEIEPSMGGEDFSQYGLAGVPVFMFRLGTVSQKRLDELKAAGKEPPSLHSPEFYPDAAHCLQTGVATMSAAVLDLLPRKPARSS
jgi:hippurate hydrolase